MDIKKIALYATLGDSFSVLNIMLTVRLTSFLFVPTLKNTLMLRRYPKQD
eukprot:gnl/Chilomastix_caulleri/7208.p1 GENE.gnl/Chilomastix_caulleri/7208~~gnl/Chilomastix_caulleri/7208.p1  ORF type:complete len:50 (+),score=4.59 gnl/Chilomastix_caulleri/7208:3-152(+)